jgi:hypothetical protein
MPEAKLVLQPTIDDLTRQELEDHIEVVRAKRVVAALEYHAGQRAKLEYELEVVQKKVQRAYEQLGKKIERLDRALEVVEEQMRKCEELKTEMGFILDYELVEEAEGKEEKEDE